MWESVAGDLRAPIIDVSDVYENVGRSSRDSWSLVRFIMDLRKHIFERTAVGFVLERRPHSLRCKALSAAFFSRLLNYGRCYLAAYDFAADVFSSPFDGYHNVIASEDEVAPLLVRVDLEPPSRVSEGVFFFKIYSRGTFEEKHCII